MYVCVYVCMCGCGYVCLCECVYVCMCVCVHVCICECVYVCIHVCCVLLVLDILLFLYIVVLGAGIPLEQGVQLYLRVLCNL
jgi:hypothetical protein